MDNTLPSPVAPKPDDTPLQTNLVSNIPIHMAGNPQPVVANQHDDSKIMRDVGEQLKKEDNHKPKRHFWDKKPDNQPTKISTQPVPKGSPPASPAPAPPLSVAQVPHPTAPAQPAAAKLAPKQPAKPKSSVPVGAITFTLAVTGVLIFIAYSSLK